MSICGLDFGTSNTTLGTIEDEAPVLAALENGQTTVPSAIFYQADGAVLIGRKAVDAYVEGVPGRLMRSLKSVLGTALIEETTRLGRERTSFRGVIALPRRGETARRAVGRSRTARGRAWPPRAFRSTTPRRRPQGRNRSCARSPARSV
jgi:molecular chaperone DnaK (HSP70)